jgi:hypothetical protein
MSLSLQTLNELFKSLPPTSQAEVINFAEFIAKKRKKKARRKLRQSWAGALAEYRDQYTSIELQKLAMEWRTN